MSAFKARSDADNLARFLDLSPAVNSPSPDGTGAVVRPDGLGPAAEADDPEGGLFQPGKLPIEQLDNICRVGGAELPSDSELDTVGVEIDDDLTAEGGALVEESLSNAIALHKSSQRASTQNIWKGPQQKFLVSSQNEQHDPGRLTPISVLALMIGNIPSSSQAFFRGLARLRAGESTPVSTEVVVTEQKLVTFLK